MSGVAVYQASLCANAIAYAAMPEGQCLERLLSSAIAYAKAKRNNANKRDGWKARKRLQENTNRGFVPKGR
jgi:hypothetical protein